MKNPLPFVIFLVIAMIAMGFELPFIIPAVVIFFVVNGARKRRRNQPEEPGQRGRSRNRRRGNDPYQQRRQQSDYRTNPEPRRRRQQNPPPRPRSQPRARPKPNPFKTSGVAKYKDFDYEGAIEDFKKALEINPNDIPTHFNIACAYSLIEEKDLAYQHIDKLIQLGFKDKEKIKTHDAFAYIRIQDDFEAFEKNGFRITSKMDIPQQADNSVDPMLLERLKKLAELRDRGILTEEEFVIQKEKLLR